MTPDRPRLDEGGNQSREELSAEHTCTHPTKPRLSLKLSLSLYLSLLAGAANLSVRLHVLYRQGGEAAQAQAGG